MMYSQFIPYLIKKAILKARIVINDEGNLKIQCVFCNKTQGNIITHAKGNKCKLVYSKQLQELKDRLRKLQRQNRNRKHHEKNKERNNQKNRISYAENPNPKRAKSRENYAK